MDPAGTSADGAPAHPAATPSTEGVVVVTGGSAGLGRAVVRTFAEAGYDVAVLARGPDGLAAAVADVRAAGRRAVGVPCDVSDHEQVEASADEVERVLGPITVWVNNAMAGVLAPLLEIEPDDFERATRVTYLGCVNGTRAALRRMTRRDRGVVVQISSALAFRGIPLQSAYCAAKHAIVGFTESVITELLHDRSRVRVCMVHMPALNTIQFNWVRSRLPKHPQPVPPIYQPEVGAKAVLHVARHPRRSTWVGAVTGATILGNRVVAPLLDRYLGRTGYASQQTSGDPHDEIGDNLWAPVGGDHGARGDFDDRSWTVSPELELTLHRRAALVGVGVAAALVMAALRGTRGTG